MIEDGDRSEWQLLDARLDRLSAEEAGGLKARLASSPELARKDALLGDLLAILDRDEVVHPSCDLTAKILERTTAATLSFPGWTKEEAEPAEPALASGLEVAAGGRGWGVRDLLALAACLALMLAIGVPGYRKAQQMSQRSLCLNNLRGIGQSTQAYAHASNGFLPYANYIQGGSWLPARQVSQPLAPNSRHIFRLVANGQVTNFRIFICPSASDGQPLQVVDPRQLLNFPMRSNNSYSFIFMNRPAGRRLDDLRQGSYRQMVLAADRNPHFESAEGLAADASGESNSPLHERGAGQNAIYVDGSGGWFKRPAIGVDGDDIYRAGLLTHYRGIEEPLYETDSFLP